MSSSPSTTSTRSSYLTWAPPPTVFKVSCISTTKLFKGALANVLSTSLRFATVVHNTSSYS
eukprot:1775683-Lingulodinium_polyedra.AAC.1